MKISSRTLGNAAIVFSLMFLHFLILVVPYFARGYAVPVGWDTPWYIRNLRIIAERGLPTFFMETQAEDGRINLYSILGHFVSSVFHVSIIDTEKIFPIIIAAFFPLVNFLIVKKFLKSWRLSLLAMFFSITDFNIMRLTVDLHRNLLSFLLVEIALFLFLPDLLKRLSYRKFVAFVVLLVLAGLSQLETFALVMLTLSILLLFHIWQRQFQRAKLLFLYIIVPSSLVTLFEFPFLPMLLRTHKLFDSSYKFVFEDYVANQFDYLFCLGTTLIPFFFVGLYSSLSTFYENRRESFLSTIAVWNLLVFAGSFLPWLTIKIPGKRFLLLATVPLLSSIGLAKILAKNRLKSIKLIVYVVVIVSASIVQFFNVSMTFEPWISNSEYNKLTWIASHVQNEPCIFVLYFNYAEGTFGFAEMYRFWVWDVIGLETNVYFGKVNYLLDSLPTPSKNEYVNETSYSFWNELRELRVNQSLIYLIEDWYKPPSSPIQDGFVEVHPGIYQIMVA